MTGSRLDVRQKLSGVKVRRGDVESGKESFEESFGTVEAQLEGFNVLRSGIPSPV